MKITWRKISFQTSSLVSWWMSKWVKCYSTKYAYLDFSLSVLLYAAVERRLKESEQKETENIHKLASNVKHSRGKFTIPFSAVSRFSFLFLFGSFQISFLNEKKEKRRNSKDKWWQVHKHSFVLSLRPQSSLFFVHRSKDKYWIDGWLSANDSSRPWRSPVRLNRHSIVSNNYSHRYITLFHIFAPAHFNWFDDGPKFQIYYSVFVFSPFSPLRTWLKTLPSLLLVKCR